MQFLRTLFWVILAVVAVIAAFNNWTPVTLTLWSGLLLDAKLPVLLLVAFLAGLLPAWGVGQARRWRLKRRLDAAERALAELRPAPAAVPAAPPRATEPPLPAGRPIHVAPGPDA